MKPAREVSRSRDTACGAPQPVSARPAQQAGSGARAGPVVRELAVVALIILVGLALRLAFLGRKSLWLDEAMTLRIALMTPAQLWRLVNEPHPPLYNLFMHGWVALGRSEVMLRLPSVLFAVQALPILYGLGRDWGGTKVAALAAALLAVAPLHIWYSQEARMYSMVSWLALLAAFLALRALHGRGRGYWIGAVLATLAAMYTDYSAIIWLWIGGLVFLAQARRRPELRSHLRVWSLAHGVLLIGYLPWLPMLWQHARGVVPAQFEVFGASLFRALSVPVAPVQGEAVLPLVGALVAVLALALAWWRGANAGTWLESRWWLGGALGALFAASLIAALVPRGYLAKRESLIGLPFLLLGVAWAILRAKHSRMLAGGGVALSLGISLLTLVFVPKEQWREAAAFVQAQQAAGDVIVLQPAWAGVAFDYYYRGGAREIGLEPGAADLDVAVLRWDTRRLWLVQYVPPPPLPPDPLVAALDGSYPLQLSHEWYRVRARLYAVK